jgi:RNA polymerase-binding transcription factor DksA
MPAYALSRVAEPHADRAIPGGRASAAPGDLLDHPEHGRDAAGRGVAAVSHTVTSADDEPRANSLTPTPAPITEAPPERGTDLGRCVRKTGAVAGPSARLRALPQPIAGHLAAPEGVDDHLAQLETARQAQLDALSAAPRNVVAAAHRETVVWILDQVRAARRRLREDVYGLCARCGGLIPPVRLTTQPWVITCTVCDPPGRPVLSPLPATER